VPGEREIDLLDKPHLDPGLVHCTPYSVGHAHNRSASWPLLAHARFVKVTGTQRLLLHRQVPAPYIPGGDLSSFRLGRNPTTILSLKLRPGYCRISVSRTFWASSLPSLTAIFRRCAFLGPLTSNFSVHRSVLRHTLNAALLIALAVVKTPYEKSVSGTVASFCPGALGSGASASASFHLRSRSRSGFSGVPLTTYDPQRLNPGVLTSYSLTLLSSLHSSFWLVAGAAACLYWLTFFSPPASMTLGPALLNARA